MDAFDKAHSVEDLFKELDENKYADIAKSLAAYRNELMKHGFTRRESVRLVEAYSKFIYDMCIEEYIADKRQEELEEEFLDAASAFEEDLDEDDPEEYSG